HQRHQTIRRSVPQRPAGPDALPGRCQAPPFQRRRPARRADEGWHLPYLQCPQGMSRGLLAQKRKDFAILTVYPLTPKTCNRGKTMLTTRTRLASVIVPALLCSQITFADSAALQELIVADHRSEANIARNDVRHPVETLTFFGIEPDMTVIEILPGGGWYTEILAPYLKDEGTYYAAHFSPNSELSYQPPALQQFEERLAANPEVYGNTILTNLYPPA